MLKYQSKDHPKYHVIKIKENANIFNFEISKEDMKKLNNVFRIGMNPNEVYVHPEIIKE